MMPHPGKERAAAAVTCIAALPTFSQHHLQLPPRATINRYGFNSEGADAAADRLEAFWRRVAADPKRKPGAALTSVCLCGG